MKFTDESCFSCGVEFTENDDVVVCPECGTPYHRECYDNEGKCINNDLHENGGRWRKEPVHEHPSPEEGVRICPKCFCRNAENAEICRGCGCRMPSRDENGGINIEPMLGNTDNVFLKPYLGFNPDEDLGGATVKELYVFVDSNTIYYIPIFKRMKDSGTKMTLNLASFLFPYFYFANRKMWFWGIIAAIVSVILRVPATLYTVATSEIKLDYISDVAAALSAQENSLLILSEICSVANWVFRIVVCMFANRLYFRFAVRSIARLRTVGGGAANPASLREKGGINPSNMLIMLLILMGISFAASFILVFVLTAIQQISF